jgi:membrane dipeptidase
MMIKKWILSVLWLCIGSCLSAQSYKKVHRKAVVVDTHNDVLSSVTMKGMSIETDLTGQSHSDIQKRRYRRADFFHFLQ